MKWHSSRIEQTNCRCPVRRGNRKLGWSDLENEAWVVKLFLGGGAVKLFKASRDWKIGMLKPKPLQCACVFMVRRLSWVRLCTESYSSTFTSVYPFVGANVNKSVSCHKSDHQEKFTPLFLACREGQLQIIDLLIQAGNAASSCLFWQGIHVWTRAEKHKHWTRFWAKNQKKISPSPPPPFQQNTQESVGNSSWPDTTELSCVKTKVLKLYLETFWKMLHSGKEQW